MGREARAELSGVEIKRNYHDEEKKSAKQPFGPPPSIYSTSISAHSLTHSLTHSLPCQPTHLSVLELFEEVGVVLEGILHPSLVVLEYVAQLGVLFGREGGREGSMEAKGKEDELVVYQNRHPLHSV